MKTSQTTSSIFSVILSFLATQHHNLHMILLMLLGGSMDMMGSMSAMSTVREAMILLTIVTIVWSIYRLVKNRCKEMWIIGMTSVSAIVSMIFIVKTVTEFGW